MPNANINILCVDDDADDFFLLQSIIKKINSSLKYILTHAENYDSALSLLSTHSFDLCMVDYKLGKYTGIDLLQAIKQHYPYMPVIMLTGVMNDDVDEKVLQAGASDFLVKGNFTAQTLKRTLHYALRDAKNVQALNIISDRFKRLFDNSNDSTALLNSQGTIIHANPIFIQQFLGTNNDKSIHQIFKKNSTLINNYNDCVANDKELLNYETTINILGTQKPVLIDVLFHDVANGIYELVIKDLTYLKEKEAETISVKRFASTGRVARVLAHEIKNPLTNISLSVGQLYQELPKDVLTESGDLIDIIKRNAERINDLISQLLNSTKFSELQLSTINAQQLVNDSLALAQDSINLHNIKVVKNLYPVAVTLKIDIEKIKIALLNIIVNAIEAMGQTQGQLTVSSSYSEQENKYSIAIEDNGVGIEPDKLDRLFEPYYTNKPNGTGLGLTNAQNIMLSHNGILKVKSKPNEGTCFTFVFTL